MCEEVVKRTAEDGSRWDEAVKPAELWNTHRLNIHSNSGHKDGSTSTAVFQLKRWWHRGAVGRVSDLRWRGRGFESRPGTQRRNPGQVSHTYVPLFTKQYKLVPA